MTTKTTAAPGIRERVTAGAAWLDRNRPGWMDRIDLITLDVEDPELCVIGQLYDDWPSDLTQRAVAEAHGFFVGRETGRLFTSVSTEYAALTEAWKEYVLTAAPVASCCPCEGTICDPGCPCTSCPKSEAELTDD